MRPRLLLLATLLLLSPVSAQSNQVSQTARQALLEMFFGTGADHLEKHLPEVTRNSLKKINSPQGQSVLAEFAMIAAQARTQGTGFETFDTGPTLLTAEDSRGNAMERVEITVERDDLIGEEDQIELALHMTRNGKENRLPFVPRFLFIMKSEKDVWRLSEISVTVRLPLSDPAFLKTIEDQQRAQNEQMTIWMVRQVGTAEKGYLAAQGSYACSLSALGNSGKKPNGKVYLWDPELASGRKNGYNLVISNCDASHYKVVAEPAAADTGLRAFCSDESGVLHASQDGKAVTCLSRGEIVDDGSKAYGLAASGEDPAAHTPKDSDPSKNAPTK